MFAKAWRDFLIFIGYAEPQLDMSAVAAFDWAAHEREQERIMVASYLGSYHFDKT